MAATTTLFDMRSPWQDVFVGERAGVRFLRFGREHGGWQGAQVVRHPRKLYFPYQQAFSLHTAWCPHVDRFLCIGVGTATAMSHVHWRHPHAEMVGVDVDPLVIEVAKRFFGAPVDERAAFVAADARLYVPRMEDAFDLVFVDAYYRERVPQTFVSSVFLAALARLISPAGVLMMNVIMAPGGRRSRSLRKLCGDLEALIGPTWMIPLGVLPRTPQNILVIAQRRPTPIVPARTLWERAVGEMRAHPEIYSSFARLLPMRIRQVPAGRTR
ncbi:MAG: fused MFS/spermidine synthase [Firmicutes bacterium]|nr:fused MFS/spermidine synthase [Bacillota bacterium]